MRLSTPAKILRTVVCLSIFFAGCSDRGGGENGQVAGSPARSEVPFGTREPDVFQAEIVVRSGDTERRMSIARDGQRSRIDYDIGTEDHRAVMVTDKEYLLFFKRMMYEERTLTPGSSAGTEFTSHLLNLRDFAAFEETGRDGAIVQYRARVNGSDAADVLIFFDESIGLPVKQEFYSTLGGGRKLQYSVELRDFRPAVAAEVFQIPAGFRIGSPKPER